MGYSAQCCAGGAYDTQRMEVGEGMKRAFVLATSFQREAAKQQINWAPDGHIVTISPPNRNLEQNAKLWAMLSDVSRAEPEERKHTPEVWKALFMAACSHEVRFEMGLDNKPFPVGFSTSKLSVKEFADLIEFIYAWATPRGVIWSEPNPYERK